MNRFLSSFLSCALILLSPGFAPYQALAAELEGPVAVRPVTIEAPIKPMVLPTVEVTTLNQLPSLPTVELNAGITPQAAAVQAAAVQAATAKPAAATAQAQTAKALTTLSASIHETLNNTGNISKAEAATAYSAGGKLQSQITGERLFELPGSPVSSANDGAARAAAPVSGPRGYLAKPAGQEISDSAKAMFGTNGPGTPVPPNNNNDGGGNGGNERIPLIPRIITSLFAAAPIVLAWPLIAGGSLVTGGLIAAASLGVAAMPWMGPSTSKAVRSIPGVFIAGLGVAVIASGVPALAGWTIASGALTALGGWGFVRFARDPNKWKYQSSSEMIGTFFGSLAAVGGAALAVSFPAAGLLVIGGRVLATGFTLPLLAQLPGWIGETIAAPIHGSYLTLRDSFRVFGAVRRDTVWFKRLSAYTEAAVKKPWNVVWLGLVVWLPVLLIEAAWQTVGFAWGLVLSVARALPMAAWGLSHGLYKESKAAQFFATWAETVFSVSKVKVFNRFESKLIPWANGQSKIKSVLAALGIRALQVLWIPASAVLTLGAALVLGPIRAFQSLGQPVPKDGKYPDSMSLERDTLSENVPSVETPKTVASTPGRLLAAAIALVPAFFFGVPLVLGGSGLFAPLIAAMYLSIAAMPLMPESDKVPAFLRGLPATTLKLGGFFAALGAARYAFVGLPVADLLGLGILTFAAGVGLARLTAKLRDGQTKSWQLESPEYIGGFISALGVATAFGISLLGLGGPLFSSLMIGGAISSVFLLAFLPAAFWKGVGSAFVGVPAGVRPVYKALGFWGKPGADFRDNMSEWFRHYTRKSGWNAIYFIVPWGAAAVLMLAELLASLAFGLVAGLVRAPANFAWSAAYNAEKPGRFGLWSKDGRGTRFFAGFAKAWQSWSTGDFSRDTVFAALTGWLAPALGRKSATTSRPTFAATLALLATLVLKAVWLVYAAAALALGWIPALVAGVINASGAKKTGQNGVDPDRPTDRLGIFGL